MTKVCKMPLGKLVSEMISGYRGTDSDGAGVPTQRWYDALEELDRRFPAPEEAGATNPVDMAKAEDDAANGRGPGIWCCQCGKFSMVHGVLCSCGHTLSVKCRWTRPTPPAPPVAPPGECSKCGRRYNGPGFCFMCNGVVEYATPKQPEAPATASAAPDPACSCSHPRGWHRKNEGSCLECACLVFNLAPPVAGTEGEWMGKRWPRWLCRLFGHCWDYSGWTECEPSGHFLERWCWRCGAVEDLCEAQP